MKIAIAQTRSVKGDINYNIANHKKLITLAVEQGAGYVFFPELSITSYEPELAKELSMDMDDSRLNGFQEISNKHNITIGVGMPTRGIDGTLISMIIFQPNQPRQAYSKQHLHSDEIPFFIGGQKQVYIDGQIAPGICYETSLPHHWENAHNSGAHIYVASVAKSAAGIEKSGRIFPEMAKKYSMTVFLCNSLGPCDNFMSVGRSAIWNNRGELLAQLDNQHEGILLLDTDSGKAIRQNTEAAAQAR